MNTLRLAVYAWLIVFGCTLWMPVSGLAAPTSRPTSRPTTTQPSPWKTSLRRPLRRLQILLSRTVGKEERAILRGLRWMTRFVEKEKVFAVVYCEYLFVLKTLHLHRSSLPLGAILRELGAISVRRLMALRHRLFDKDLAGKWDFLNVLPMILQFQGPSRKLSSFYKAHFPATVRFHLSIPFPEARQKQDMDRLLSFLIEYSFVHYVRRKRPRLSLRLPLDKFPSFVRQLKGLPFPHRFEKNRLAYSMQNYFLTHINAVLTNFGEFPQKRTRLTQRIERYWRREWRTIRDKVGDFDLMAEVVFCFKLYGIAHLPPFKSGIKRILALQNRDGSWGSPKTLRGGYYTAIHPTWTALTALVTPNRRTK